MKKIFLLLSIFAIALTSCEGDQGPIGPEGPQGPQGPAGDGSGSESALIFEVDNVNLSYEAENNLWSTRLTFSELTDSEVFENDIVFIYRLNGQVDLEDGAPADSWSLLPQNFFTEEGTIQYVTTHTFLDTDIFIDGDYNLSNLSADFTSNQIFRVAIVRSEVAARYNGDSPSLKTLMTELNIQNGQINKVRF